jgi:hypothetical protein
MADIEISGQIIQDDYPTGIFGLVTFLTQLCYRHEIIGCHHAYTVVLKHSLFYSFSLISLNQLSVVMVS